MGRSLMINEQSEKTQKHLSLQKSTFKTILNCVHLTQKY